MLKHSITYTDFDGNQRTEDFYFNLSKAEIARLEIDTMTFKGLKLEGETKEDDVEVSGGFQAKLKAIVESGSGKLIMDTFEEIIRASYGKRTEDGRSFIKDDHETKIFMGSPAYDEFFMKIVTDANFAANFINAVVPPEFNKTSDKPTGMPSRTETMPAPMPKSEVMPQAESTPLKHQDITDEELEAILEARRRNNQ